MKQYEYIYVTNKKLHARIFDSETKESKLFSYDVNEYTPELFIPTNNQTEFVSHADNKSHLKKVEFESISQMSNFIKENSTVFNIHGNKNPVMKFTRDFFPNTLESNHDFRTHFIDIETRSKYGFPNYENPVEEVTLIQFYDNFEEKYYILGTLDYDNSKLYDHGEVKYIKCNNELDLLNRWVLLVLKLNPTIMVGFNSNSFDFPYLINRMRKVNLKPERLSPNGLITEKEATTKDGISYIEYNIVGRLLMDYRELYLKYSFAKLPKHNLETIASYELGEGKLDHGEFTSFEEFYLNDYQKFVEYGIKDVEILVSLDRKLKLINTAKYIAYLCGVNIPDVMGTYKQWFSYMYNTCLNNGEILPLEQMYANEDDGFPGGWVLSKPAKYEWVISYDALSLYPNVTKFLNIGVDTLLKPNEIPQELIELREKYFSWYNQENCDKLKEKNHNEEEQEAIKLIIDNREAIHSVLEKYNVCASPNGYFYKKDKMSSYSSVLRNLGDRRNEAKKEAKKHDNLYNEVVNELKSRGINI